MTTTSSIASLNAPHQLTIAKLREAKKLMEQLDSPWQSVWVQCTQCLYPIKLDGAMVKCGRCKSEFKVEIA
jgi:rubrerythrin